MLIIMTSIFCSSPYLINSLSLSLPPSLPPSLSLPTALSTTSSRDSPTHIVVLRNGRIQTEHDYASIKSRDSPAPKGGFVIYNFPNGSGNPGNPYVIPHPSESPFHRPMVSNGTLNGFLGSSVEKSDSSTKESDNEPLYSNIKTKTNTL